MFLTKDRKFYRTLTSLMFGVILQNIIAYSINMADNLMLGSYSQASLCGAATVNQIQFVLQQMTLALGDSLVIIASQYWGQKRTSEVRSLTVIALICGSFLGIILFILTSLFPVSILSLFTDDPSYIREGLAYLKIIRFTYPLYILFTILISSLRSVEIVNVALKISIFSLITDVTINEILIFGRFGFPQLGITGAAIGTLTSRILELTLVCIYLLSFDTRLQFFSHRISGISKQMFARFFKILTPSFISNTLWSIATPIQTSILGHLSSDAIAANSVSTTLFQYLKVITVGEASASSVFIGTLIGSDGKNKKKIKEYTVSLQWIYLFAGCFLAFVLFMIRHPFLSMYDLSSNAYQMSDQLLLVLCIVFLGMAYQMPAGVGIIKGGGDASYVLFLNVISTWLIVIPISYLAAFVWKLPVFVVVIFLNSDQIFKCIPTYIHVNRYRWIRTLTN